MGIAITEVGHSEVLTVGAWPASLPTSLSQVWLCALLSYLDADVKKPFCPLGNEHLIHLISVPT